MYKNRKELLSIITVLFFALGFVNIVFAWLGFACMIMPFAMLAKDKKKNWCQGYCPRANLFTVLFRKISITHKSAPKWLTKGKTKWFVLIYFVINLFFLSMSTLMVFLEKRQSMEFIRLFIAIKLPWNIPQLIQLNSFQDWIIHLSFRMYSVMLSTTILGLLLALIFKPRTWCTVCPVNTVSDLVLRKISRSK